MFDLVVIGHLLKEKIIFADGREIGPVLGSPSAYASIASAKLGLKVGLVTKIGKDMPEELMRVFKEVKIDTEGVKIGNDTTTNLLIYKKSGDKKLEFLEKADDISFDDIPGDYLDAGFFLICPINYEVERELIIKLYQKGKRLSMELSGFGGASSERKKGIDFFKEMVKYFEIVKGGGEDYRYIFGKIDEEDAKKFIKWGAKISILTLGEKGALIITEKSSLKIPSFQTKVIDITGAGDVWHAGFLCEYLKKGDLKKAGIFASCLSSLVIEKTGGVIKERFPTYRETEERIKELMEQKGGDGKGKIEKGLRVEKWEGRRKIIAHHIEREINARA